MKFLLLNLVLLFSITSYAASPVEDVYLETTRAKVIVLNEAYSNDLFTAVSSASSNTTFEAKLICEEYQTSSCETCDDVIVKKRCKIIVAE